MRTSFSAPAHFQVWQDNIQGGFAKQSNTLLPKDIEKEDYLKIISLFSVPAFFFFSANSSA